MGSKWIYCRRNIPSHNDNTRTGDNGGTSSNPGRRLHLRSGRFNNAASMAHVAQLSPQNDSNHGGKSAALDEIVASVLRKDLHSRRRFLWRSTLFTSSTSRGSSTSCLTYLNRSWTTEWKREYSSTVRIMSPCTSILILSISRNGTGGYIRTTITTTGLTDSGGAWRLSKKWGV